MYQLDDIKSYRIALDAIIKHAKQRGVIIRIEEEQTMMKCDHALSGCNYPESECIGLCMQVREKQDFFAGKTIEAVRREPGSAAIAMKFTDGSGAYFEVDNFRTIRVITLKKEPDHGG